MPDAKFLIKVSRPRFWLYVFGPYLVGLAAAASSGQDFLRLDAALFALFFLFPANLLIYGVNDIFDFETDRRNPKKEEYEMLVRPESHRHLAIAAVLLNVPFIAAALVLAPQALPSLAGFLFFSIFYSAPPIRAKAIPFFDSAFNVLYVFPGAFAYQMLTGSFMPLSLFIAAGLWTMAMHAYSAIPDIDAATLAFNPLGYFAAALAAVYAAMIALSWFSKKEDGVFSIYRYFPILNAAVGFALFWIVAWGKLL